MSDAETSYSPDPEDPARHFLKAYPVGKWSIMNYLNANRELLGTKNGFSILCDSWLRELARVIDDTAVSDRKRKAATKLLNRYKVAGEDHRAARVAYDLAKIEKSGQPQIVITGSNTFTNATVSLNASIPPSSSPEPGPAFSTRKRKREGKRPAAAPGFIKHFAESFRCMDKSQKWLLPSGICVEDQLYNCFKNAPKECAVHSWVIDIRDTSVQGCFPEEKDWEAICAAVPPMPDPNLSFVRSMLQFATLRTADQLRDYLDITPAFKPEELPNLTPEERLGRRWVNTVLRCWSDLCQTPNVFEQNHREFCGESKSLCTTDRKNLHPEHKKRKRIGHLYDGILQINGHEVGVAEHARYFAGEKEKKWVADTLKVVKVLHDMLYHLQMHVHPDSPSGLGGLHVVGMVTAGWRCQFLRMVYGKGYICLLSTDDVRKIPTSVENISSLLELLGFLWKTREMLNRCEATINPILTPEQLAERLMKPSSPALVPPKSTLMIPRSVETDDGITTCKGLNNGNDTEEETEAE
ncbi:hypothetical protein DFP73DRAFT_615846 [Morchella snyderi]|nr:hypothetical protein DFP73DRAFT_615846 [Morchella snyderi]